MHQEPLVGIITPVHNGEPFLEQCIQSVLNQSYKNWIYVIANNSSTDRSLDIAREYAAKDSRIQVHSSAEFRRQMNNFNWGLSLIPKNAGFYKIVQADDWIFPECLELMVELAVRHPRIGIVSSYQLAGTHIMGEGLPITSTVVPGPEICRFQLLTGHFLFGSPTAVLFRGEVVRSRTPFFSETALHSDTDACYATLRDWDFGFVHQVLTFYRTDNEGMSSRTRHLNPNSLDKFIIMLTHGRAFLDQEEFETQLKAFRRRYFRMLTRDLFFPGGWNQLLHHRRSLKSIQYDLSLSKLSPYLLVELADLVFNPKKTIGEAVTRLNRLRHNSHRPRWSIISKGTDEST